MPRIIIHAEPTSHREPVTVVLSERIEPSDLESERFGGRLIERVGWALVDARDVEDRAA